jgi:hypothetical protein
LSKVLTWFDGKKTYLGALAFAGLGVFQFATGSPEQGIASLIAAWTSMGVRSAIGSVAPAPVRPNPVPIKP